MPSKINILGHPLHPMLIAFPVAFYTGTLAGFVGYAIIGTLFWLKLAIALSAAGSAMAIIAALPGFIDWAMGIPTNSPAKRTGLIHMVLNLAALGLFIASFFLYYGHWHGPANVDPTIGIILTAIGVALTIAAGFQGWILVQTHHMGVRVAPEHERVGRDTEPL